MIAGFETIASRWRQVRYNPLRSLTPERLASALDSWEAGWLRDAGLIFETIGKRDAICTTVLGKRKRKVSRCQWQVTLREDIEEADQPEAEAHKKTLEFFYRNLAVTDATNLNLLTRVGGLAKQMMTAALQDFAAHEILWKPLEGGLTAELRFVPIYFFENRTGRLRFVGPESRADGIPLDENGWMITCLEGVGPALATCYMVRRLYMQDALSTSDKFAVPAVLGETNHKKGSPEATAFENAIANFGSEFVGCIFNSDGSIKDPIKIIQAATAAGIPQQAMIDYMDRLITILCQGGDLGTLSREDSQGASLQGEESGAMVDDDCATISEVLNIQLDALVIRMVHGDVEPLAKFEFIAPGAKDQTKDLAIDEGLQRLGVVQKPEDLAERYDREHDETLAAEKAAKAQAIATATAKAEESRQPSEPGGSRSQAKPNGVRAGSSAPPVEEAAENEGSPQLDMEIQELELALAVRRARKALAADLQPLGDALFAAYQAGDGAAMRGALRKISKTMPEFLQGGALAELMAEQNAAALIEGAEQLN